MLCSGCVAGLNMRRQHRSPSCRHTMVLPSHLNSVTRNSSEKTTCRQFLSTAQSWTLAAHRRLAALILLLVRGFHLAIRPCRPPACNLKQSRNVVINIIESDKVINSLIMIGNWSGSFCLCAIFYISTYLLRTVETETTRFNVGCHSARSVLAVTWRRLRTIALRYASFLAIVARGRPVRGRSRWDLLCRYLRMVLLTVTYSGCSEVDELSVFGTCQYCAGQEQMPFFPSTSSVLYPWSKWRNTDIAFTVTGRIYRLSADNPSAMGEV